MNTVVSSGTTRDVIAVATATIDVARGSQILTTIPALIVVGDLCTTLAAPLDAASPRCEIAKKLLPLSMYGRALSLGGRLANFRDEGCYDDAALLAGYAFGETIQPFLDPLP